MSYNNIQEWNYAHDADITFGEVHVSKAPKIALIITIISVLIVSILGIIYRDVVRDAMANPQLVLTTTNAEIDVYSEFNPEDYITAVNAGFYEITNIQSNVNTSELGTYEVIYSSKNSVNALDQVLTVEVKDITAPVILLKTRENSNLKIDFEDDQYVAEVVCGDEILENFNPGDYVDIVLDNFSNAEDISIDWSRKLDFSKAGLVTVVYSATDTSGNKGITTLNIAVVESFDADRQAYEDQIAQMEAELEALREQQNQHHSGGNTGGSGGSDGNGGNGNNDGGGNGGNDSTESSTPTLSVSDFSISIDTGIQNIFVAAANHVSCSGGNAQPIGGTLMTSQAKPGNTYTLIWECNGVQATQNITITE
ncbi:MAG: hypothetical protein IJZ79_02730 [Bacilli bacterium]|nr:hypothetical protein [Bacilli bacterium]MBQ8218640.1 hypothetical protein [Bacilli bacterium]